MLLQEADGSVTEVERKTNQEQVLILLNQPSSGEDMDTQGHQDDENQETPLLASFSH